MIKYQGAVFAASNKPYFHHPHGSFKGLRLCVKLLTWLGLIYIITQSLTSKHKAIKEDLDTKRSQIKEGCFLTNGKIVR